MIVVTGAAGFIGCNLIRKLNNLNFKHIIAVDHFVDEEKSKTLNGTHILARVGRDDFLAWASKKGSEVEFVFHLGARTDTTETDLTLLRTFNTEYTKSVWNVCVQEQIPLIYASSAATYGNGEFGFSDDHSLIPKLKPLNPYAVSKHEFDLWALSQQKSPLFWSGLKFFNVYGPHESHKGKMASMIHQAQLQIEKTGAVKLFKSYKKEYGHGEQKRDFIHVNDVCEAMIELMHSRKESGIYNLGTGKARSFNEMVAQTFRSLQKPIKIEYIEMPEELREKYQYFTEAEMGKLNEAISSGNKSLYHKLP